MTFATSKVTSESAGLIGRIPVRNLWVLLLYASDLARFFGRFDAEVEESSDLPSLIARLLSFAVERRLRRNLSRGYMRKEAVLTRIRGRIDILRTYRHDLLSRGQIAVRFDDHTIDTPRNRLVRAALDSVSSQVPDSNLASKCRRLAGDLGRLGVSDCRPSRSEMSSDQTSRHDSDDQLMVTLARIVFDLVLPTESDGKQTLAKLQRDKIVIWKLFEKAVGNFYSSYLDAAAGWRVQKGKRLNWPYEEVSSGMLAILPNMKTDIILQNELAARRIVIDTKFAPIFSKSLYRDAVLKSGYLYQMFAYLRSQENSGKSLCDRAEGVLLHPTIDADVDEYISIQGHRIRVLTVNLTRPLSEILAILRSVTGTPNKKGDLSAALSS